MTHLSGLESESETSEVPIHSFAQVFVLTNLQDEIKVSASHLGMTGMVALSSGVLHDMQVRESA